MSSLSGSKFSLWLFSGHGISHKKLKGKIDEIFGWNTETWTPSCQDVITKQYHNQNKYNWSCRNPSPLKLCWMTHFGSEFVIKSSSTPTSTSAIPELSQAHGADVQLVQENLTLVELHHTEQGQEQGGLAGACTSHDTHFLPRSHYQAHPVQGVGKTVPVGQNHTAELQPALLGPRWRQLLLKQRRQGTHYYIYCKKYLKISLKLFYIIKINKSYGSLLVFYPWFPYGSHNAAR